MYDKTILIDFLIDCKVSHHVRPFDFHGPGEGIWLIECDLIPILISHKAKFYIAIFLSLCPAILMCTRNNTYKCAHINGLISPLILVRYF